MGKKVKKVAGLEKRRRKVARGLPNPEQILRGSLVRRFIQCGKPNCICKREGGHGPYFYLTINKGAGKTLSIKIPTDQQAQVRVWLRNYRRLRKGLEAISDTNLALILETKANQ